ncbi:MAG: OmpA family protein [Candidatus Cloacimonadota bacterium]|nr:OmpA family protein [Candidatus Cloacimonadota bacterium]
MERIFKKKSFSNKENMFSLSISDLMSALLLIFILILVGTLLKLAEQHERNKDRLELISDQEMAKRSIIAQLKGEMDQFDIEVDPRTGAIRIKEAILFDYGQAELKENGKKFLQRFMPKYAEILFAKNEIREQIGQVIIEGHTDNIGPYNYNLDLSLKRAFSVASYIYSKSFINFNFGDVLRKRLSVVGKSFVDPIASNITKEGRRSNRRVEFKFSFIDWTTLQNHQFKEFGNNGNR